MVLVIAEAGVNHNGDEDLAIKLINVAKDAGADIVKFQTFKSSKSVSVHAQQAEYQQANTNKIESQLEMVSRLELSFDAHKRLLAHCEKVGIEFLSTAFDHDSLDFLVDELNVKRLKIPSGELSNAPLVLAHARTKKDIILSTGMATLAEVETALGVIAFGYISDNNASPSLIEFRKAYFSEAGREALKNKVTILHCTTEYPAPFEDINLRAMDSLQHSFKLEKGYSDHSEGIAVSIAAVARGAKIIEKHFTLDKGMDGPDHIASLEPLELKAMVQAIREVELCLGDGVKGPRPSELKNISIARKSLVAMKKISKGEIFTSDNLIIKRPGNGMSPYKYWDLLGTKATKDYDPDEFIVENFS